MIIINQDAFFLIFKESVTWKMLTKENKMILSSNYMLLTRKDIGVNGNVTMYSILTATEPRRNHY